MKKHCRLRVFWCCIVGSTAGAANGNPFIIPSSTSTTLSSPPSPTLICTPSSTDNRKRTSCHKSLTSSTRILHQLRGGAPPPSYYETNPNYSNQGGPTLGDLEHNNNGFRYPPNPSPPSSAFSFHPKSTASKPPPITTLLSNYSTNLKAFSPTIFYTTASSILLFLLWNLFPPQSTFSKRILQTHFVCSHHNIFTKHRWDAAVLSALSHTSFRHLMVNLYGFLTFGPSVKRILDGGNLGLWAFVALSALFGSLSFLLLDRYTHGGAGSCIGLSGVTLALLAFDSLVYPSKELRLFVSFIPVQLPAYYLLMGLVGWSVLGVLGMMNGGGGNVAHSTHLGGLVFGAVFYEAFSRGYVRIWKYRLRKFYFRSKRG
mmetsp:Transcript_12188/g.25697  ORF Transcript_12188/g.25697 Transcript_12188/m.25697 type:complete len:372 (+) Transcript_12188:113-1228(+)